MFRALPHPECGLAPGSTRTSLDGATVGAAGEAGAALVVEEAAAEVPELGVGGGLGVGGVEDAQGGLVLAQLVQGDGLVGAAHGFFA